MYLKDLFENHRKEVEELVRWSPIALKSHPVCDFCGDDDPYFIYASSRTSNDEKIRNWRWCACTACSYLVDNNRHEELQKRVEKRLRKLLPPEMMRNRTLLMAAVRMSLLDFYVYAIEVENDV
jgi:hypothetical protein